jgi:multisubunit Na+/H+ antiporter MnhB subunit
MKARRIYGLILAAAVAFVLVQAVQEMPAEPGGLTETVAASMDQSGVYHPVTGVLLNFRAYDTWLELGVLLLAVMGVLLFQGKTDLTLVRPLPQADPVLRRALALLLPLGVLASGYLLWIGKYAAGGAFQAGVVLGAALILMWLSGTTALVILPGPWFRTVLALGFSAFLLVAAGLALFGAGMLHYPVPQAGNLILFIEACATLSIGWTMAALIIGLQPGRDGGSAP